MVSRSLAGAMAVAPVGGERAAAARVGATVVVVQVAVMAVGVTVAAAPTGWGTRAEVKTASGGPAAVGMALATLAKAEVGATVRARLARAVVAAMVRDSMVMGWSAEAVALVVEEGNALPRWIGLRRKSHVLCGHRRH